MFLPEAISPGLNIQRKRIVRLVNGTISNRKFLPSILKFIRVSNCIYTPLFCKKSVWYPQYGHTSEESAIVIHQEIGYTIIFEVPGTFLPERLKTVVQIFRLNHGGYNSEAHYLYIASAHRQLFIFVWIQASLDAVKLSWVSANEKGIFLPIVSKCLLPKGTAMRNHTR